MLHSRVRLSQKTSRGLDRVSKRIGIRKNLLCRVAILYSLEKGTIDPIESLETDGLEFNLPTLFGSFTGLFVDMINIVQPDSTNENWTNYAHMHIDRGVEYLQSNAFSLQDISTLFRGT